PRRFQGIAARDPFVCVYAPAHESRVFRTNRVIHTNVAQMALQRLLRDMAESDQDRVSEANDVRADLLIALVVDEEEELVFLNRPAESAPVLLAHKEGVPSMHTCIRGRIETKRTKSPAVRLNFT